MPACQIASAARTYTRVGASRASSSRWPVPGTGLSRLRRPISNRARRASEYPLLCRPELGRATMTSPGLTRDPSTGSRPGGSAPSAVPTRSSMGGPPAAGASMAPIWAISPPGMAIPASLRAQVQAAGDRLEDVLVDPVGGHVVQQRQRHRPGADHVVDVVGHAVDPDGFPPVRLPGQQDLGADPVGGQRERRPGRDVQHGSEVAAGQAGDAGHHGGPDLGPGQPGTHGPGEDVLLVLFVDARARVGIHAGNATEFMVTRKRTGARAQPVRNI